MRDLSRKGICTTNELESLIEDIRDTINIINTTNEREDFKTKVHLDYLKIEYKDGMYEAAIRFDLGHKVNDRQDEHEERPFNEST